MPEKADWSKLLHMLPEDLRVAMRPQDGVLRLIETDNFEALYTIDTSWLRTVP